MGDNYKTTKGTYREIVSQVTEIRDVTPPTIQASEEYDRTFVVDYKAKDNISVQGVGGRLNIRVDQGNFGFWNRVKQAYALVKGKNLKVRGGGPDKATIENSLIVQEYLADSKAFNEAIQNRRMQSFELISDRQFEITTEGVKRIPLEDRLPK